MHCNTDTDTHAEKVSSMQVSIPVDWGFEFNDIDSITDSSGDPYASGDKAAQVNIELLTGFLSGPTREWMLCTTTSNWEQ